MAIANNQDQVYITKPRASSCGRGISVINSATAMSYTNKSTRRIVQEYISNPYLINGYKFDLRVYVLVTSFAPLRMYVYDEGLVRFASEKYNKKKLNNLFMHITNTAVNEKSDKYEKNQTEAESQSKWSFKHLKEYFTKVKNE